MAKVEKISDLRIDATLVDFLTTGFELRDEWSSRPAAPLRELWREHREAIMRAEGDEQIFRLIEAEDAKY